MGTNARERVSHAPVPEHEQVIEYMNSADWQGRLEEARARRELALAARAAASEDPSRPRRPGDGLADGPGDGSKPRVPGASPGPGPAPVRPPARPSPRPANVPSRPVDPPPVASEGSDLRPPPRWRAWPISPSALAYGMLAGGAMTALAALWVIAPEPVAPPGQAEILRPAARPAIPVPAAPDVADAATSIPGPMEADQDSLARVLDDLGLDDLGSGYEVRVVSGSDVPRGSGGPETPPFELRASRFSLPNPTVMFFHPEDAAAAGRVSERLGAEMLDLTGLLPSPPAGTLEVHLANG